MKNRDAIIEKIKKLMRLAKSSNEHEAALAAARAQELLSKYNLDEAELTEQEIPKEAGVASVNNVVKKPAAWVYLLASAVAGAFDSKYFHSSDSGQVRFVGVDLDHEVASFTFGYLYRSINRLASNFMGKSYQRRLTPKYRKKARVSYCLGCTSVISQQLGKQRTRTPITTTALCAIKRKDHYVLGLRGDTLMCHISQGASNLDNHNQHLNPISPIDTKLLSEQKTALKC